MTFFKNIPSVSWGAFRWLFGFYLLTLFALGSSLRVYIHKKIDHSQSWVPQFLNQLDQALVYTLWACIFLGIIFSFVFIKRFFSPLEALIFKAKSVKKGYGVKNKAVIKESRGEWFQLDLALNRIAKDLKRKKADVEKERGELEAVMTAAHDAILAVDRDMNIRYYNAPMALFFDQKEEGNWGKKLKEVIRNQKIISAFEKAISEQRNHRIQTVQDLAIDSSTRYYDVSVSPFLNEKKGKTRGAVAIFHDITEHKKVEKVRMDFVANASHELKTPLTSIQGYLELIKAKQGDPLDTKEAFQVVDANLLRLNRLISDLLELSKIESADTVVTEDVDPKEITEQVMNDLKQSIAEKEQQVDCDYDVKFVSANKELLEHVVINLIENAIKYSPQGAQIKVLWSQNDEGSFLSVKDNGPGIESYHQGRLFERFFRVRDEKNQKTKGTGLGLSIVRNCMNSMGGHADVKSAPGLGSEFICYFPKSSNQ